MAKLRSVTTPELKCLFAMVNRIKYTTVVNIVNYFKNVPKMLGPIECTSMVTQIAINLVISTRPRCHEFVPLFHGTTTVASICLNCVIELTGSSYSTDSKSLIIHARPAQ
jgi:hypothetical protein